MTAFDLRVRAARGFMHLLELLEKVEFAALLGKRELRVIDVS